MLWKEKSYVIVLTDKAIKLAVKTAIRNPSQMSILVTSSDRHSCKLECCKAKSLNCQLSNNKRVNGRKAEAGKKKKKKTHGKEKQIWGQIEHTPVTAVLWTTFWRSSGAQEGQPAQLPSGGGHKVEATTSCFSYDVVIGKQRNQFYNWEL